MGSTKIIDGNPITDSDPLQVAVKSTALSPGQAAMVASSPVVIASDQSAIAVDTELPAAAALSDALANPTAPAVGAHLVGWDTVQWKRILQINGLLRASIGSASSVTSDGQGAPTTVTDSAAVARSLSIAPFLFNGLTWDRQRVSNVFKNVALTAATAETAVWTPAAGKKFRAIRLILTASAQTVLTFKDNTAGTTILTVELAANVPFSLELGPNGVLSAAANNVLTVTRATSAILNGTIEGTEE